MSDAVASSPAERVTPLPSVETAELVRGYDWEAVGLPALAFWPQSLRSIVDVMLHSPVAMVLLWGPDGVMIYNDAYSVFAGGRHPAQFGLPVAEGWPEVADFNRHVMVEGLAGRTLSFKDQQLVLLRNGEPEDVWMDLNYSPVLDESGRPAGVLAVVVETSERVMLTRRLNAERQAVAELNRRLAGERDALRRLFQRAPGFMAVLGGPTHVFRMANQAYLQLVGHRDLFGKPMADALPEVRGQGFVELLDHVYTTGEAYLGQSVRILLKRSAEAPEEERLVDFVYQPMRGDDGRVEGIFVQGHDVTERHRAFASVQENEANLRNATEHQRLLINELNHRVKNSLATAQSLAAQSLRPGVDPEVGRRRFEQRLMALAKAHDVLTRRNWEGADLQAIVEEAIGPYRDPGLLDRFDIGGPPLTLPPQAALAFAMTLHELATNAVKYGALSRDSGQVAVHWRSSADEPPYDLALTWKETGGPPAEAPTRRGFGTRLIQGQLAHELGGTAAFDFRPEGLVCTLAAPIKPQAGTHLDTLGA